MYEIERRGLYINRLLEYCKQIIKNCKICVVRKLNKCIIPSNIQIISHYSLERIQIDITYFNNKCELEDIRGKYLLNFKDHFSKFCKGFIINNKIAEEIIKKFKIFIKEFGKPKLVQTDNGGEFTSNF